MGEENDVPKLLGVNEGSNVSIGPIEHKVLTDEAGYGSEGDGSQFIK